MSRDRQEERQTGGETGRRREAVVETDRMRNRLLHRGIGREKQ